MRNNKVIKEYNFEGVVNIPDFSEEEMLCDFCVNTSDIYVEIEPEKYLQAKYCPMCGRKIME